MRHEIFFLAYHLHWSHGDVLALPTDERWAFVRLLSERLQKEQDAASQAKRK